MLDALENYSDVCLLRAIFWNEAQLARLALIHRDKCQFGNDRFSQYHIFQNI
jgi:hypothetical protein